MAHSPELKARVLADIALGESIRAVAATHNVPKCTIELWLKETRTAHSKTRTELGQPDFTESQAQARKRRFDDALDKFLFSTITMLGAWADSCSDPNFIKDNPTGVNELGKTVLERADRLVRVLGGPTASSDGE